MQLHNSDRAFVVNFRRHSELPPSRLTGCIVLPPAVVFFDMTADGQPLGRIEMEVRGAVLQSSIKARASLRKRRAEGPAPC